MDQQLHSFRRTCELKCNCWHGPYKIKSLNNCDNAIIIYLLLLSVDILHVLRDIKSYLDTKDHFDAPSLQMFFPFHWQRSRNIQQYYIDGDNIRLNYWLKSWG